MISLPHIYAILFSNFFYDILVYSKTWDDDIIYLKKTLAILTITFFCSKSYEM